MSEPRPHYRPELEPWRLRPWRQERGTLDTLTDDDIDEAIVGFYGPLDKATHDTVADFSALVDEQVKRKRMAKGTRGLATPPRFDKVNLDTLQPKPHQRAALEQTADALACGKGVFLYGDSGRGKSHLASAWLRSAGARGNSTMFLPCVDLIAGSKLGAEDDTARHARNADYLVIDDVASTSLTDYGKGVLFDLIDNRASFLRPTTITSNLTPAAFLVATDDRIVNRIKELCGSVPL